MKKVLFPILALVLALGLGLVTAAPAAAHEEGDPQVQALIADGGNDDTQLTVGTVSVWNDGTNLVVTYDITLAPWAITETHVDVQIDPEDIPQTGSGNPKVGKFAHRTEHAPPGVTTVPHTIPLANIIAKAGDTVYIAAQAVVEIYEWEGYWVLIDEESAWADGSDFGGKNWAMYFTYIVQ